MDGMIPVSYTHLDVYKRQGLRSPVILKNDYKEKGLRFGAILFAHNVK